MLSSALCGLARPARTLTMSRYDYRNLMPQPAAEQAFLAWIARLDHEFSNPDPVRRSEVVRDTLHELYLGRAFEAGAASGAPLSSQAMLHSFDPRNATLEP